MDNELQKKKVSFCSCHRWAQRVSVSFDTSGFKNYVSHIPFFKNDEKSLNLIIQDGDNIVLM